jgi:RND family efflux transporter MFP subunit
MQIIRARVLIPAALALAACGRGNAAESKAAEPAPAVLGAQDVAIATESEVAAGIVLTGTLQPAEVVTIRAQVPGTMTGVRADRGTPVRRAQVLGVIEAEGIRGQAAGARAGVAAAEASLALARQKLEAARTLNAAGAMSDIDRRSAEAAYEAADAQLAGARAQLASAGEQAARATIVAPLTGAVSARMVEEGEAVSVGAELFTVVDASTLELAGQIPVDRATRVRIGEPVVFTLDAAPEREYRGTVARMDPTADERTRQVGVYVRLPNRDGGIVAGQFARGRIIGERAERAIVVPAGAVRQAGDSAHVLVIEDGAIARRPVTLGPRDEARGVVAVTAGLAAGERVIATATLRLAEGERVVVASDERATARAGAAEGR